MAVVEFLEVLDAGLESFDDGFVIGDLGRGLGWVDVVVDEDLVALEDLFAVPEGVVEGVLDSDGATGHRHGWLG